MRVPYSWLQDYLQADIEIERLCHLLTMGGLEVEEIRDWTATDGGASDQILMTAVKVPKSTSASLLRWQSSVWPCCGTVLMTSACSTAAT